MSAGATPLRRALDRLTGRSGRRARRAAFSPAPELTPFDRDTLEVVRPFTMTSPARVQALIQAVRHLERSGTQGAIVECGVWRGGSMLAVARTLGDLGRPHRDLYLFDTFAGMPAPGPEDFSSHDGAPAGDLLRRPDETHTRAFATREDVARTMRLSGYPETRIHLVAGMVEETIPREAPDRIALLRLDTDWYASTRHELEHLYPRLARGGVLILDDYGWWEGARRAVDEYFGARNEAILLHVIDQSGRIGIRLDG
jgi:hypothetical protein